MFESILEFFNRGLAIAIMIIFFGGSIFVHELGHFLAAKWRGLKVLRFSIGFGPKLFAWKGKDGCEYRVSLLPFGGYVALPQLADMGRLEGGSSEESEELKEIQNLPKISYFDKVVVSSAGAFFNVLFAFLIAGIVWIIGVPSVQSHTQAVVGYVPEKMYSGLNEIDSPAFKAGVLVGDKILEVDGVRVSDFSEIAELVAMGSKRDKDGKPECSLKILRGNDTIEITLNPVLVQTNMRSGDMIRMIGVFPQSSLKVSSVMENSPAQKAGLQVGDIIEKIDGKSLYSNYQISDYLSKISKEKPVRISIVRDSKKLELDAQPQKVMLTKPSVSIESKDGILMSFFCSEYKGEDALSLIAKGSVLVLEVDTTNSLVKDISTGEILYDVSQSRISSLSNLLTIFNHKARTEASTLTFTNSRGTNLKEILLGKEYQAKEVPAQYKYMLGYTINEETVIKHPSIFQQFSDSIWRTWGALKSLVSPSSDIGLKHLTGPVGIGRVMYEFSLMDFSLVLSFVVLININLAILNMLPIPVLDGGHILFATISKLMKKPLPVGLVATLQGLFMMLFLGVMVYVLYFDVIRWSGDNAQEDMANAAQSFYIKDINFKK